MLQQFRYLYHYHFKNFFFLIEVFTYIYKSSVRINVLVFLLLSNLVVESCTKCASIKRRHLRGGIIFVQENSLSFHSNKLNFLWLSWQR